MCTPATRKNYSRATTRYQSDVTDEEWRVIEPHLPRAKDTGRPRAWPLREIINGIFYVMRSGCPWRQLHALVDTDGRGLVLEPHAASVQDRDGGGPLLQASRRIFTFIERVFADGGYAGERVATATRVIVEIVAKSAGQSAS
jgi:Putative transposase of IS4/5 family (DUF4096)/Transposase DDE domain